MPVTGITKQPHSKAPFAGNVVEGATFTVGAENESAETVNCAVQLRQSQGAGGDVLSQRTCVFAYLSDNAAGSTLAATAPSSGWAIGTNGLLISSVANKAAHFVTDAQGRFDVTLTEAGAATWYLVVVLGDGSLAISDPIAFDS